MHWMFDIAMLLVALTACGWVVASRRRVPRARLTRRDETRRRQAAEIRRLALVAARTHSAVWIADVDGRVQWVNEGYVRLTARAAAEVIGQVAPELSSVAQAFEMTPDALRARLGTGQGCRAEISGVAGDGRIYRTSIEIQPELDAAGRLVGLIAIQTDITELQAREAIIRRRVRQQSAVARLGLRVLSGAELATQIDDALVTLAHGLELPLCGVFMLTPDGQALIPTHGVGWKPGVLGTGRVEASLDTQAGFTLAAPEPVIVEDLAREARFSGDPLQKAHEVASGISVMLAGADRPLGVLAAHDVRPRIFAPSDADFVQSIGCLIAAALQRRDTDDALRVSRERLDAAVRGSSSGLWDWDLVTDRAHFSNRFTELLGCTPEMLGDRFAALEERVHPEDRIRLESDVRAHLEAHFPLDLDLRILASGGEHRWYHLRGEASRSGGRPLRLAGAMTDVTERKRAERTAAEYATGLERVNRELEEARRAAEAASRSKSEFLANMSHEIRTPMTAILGYADVLLDELDSTVARGEHLAALQTIRRNGEFLLAIINDFLDVTKIEAGRMTVEEVPLDLEFLLRDVHDLMRGRAEAKGLSLWLEREEGLPRCIRSDPIRLRQILINLVGNAVKFTESGEVRIVARVAAASEMPLPPDTGPTIEIDVIDTGIGLAEDEVHRLFQPFMQADTSTTRRFGGTGLGLAISRRLALMLDGDLTVTSEKGRGSRFRLSFCPGLAREAAPSDSYPTGFCESVCAADGPGEPCRTEQTADALAGASILLAEDGLDNQRLISHMLRKAGAEVIVVENGQVAVEAALRAQEECGGFDAILMDMQMPVMDGYDAVGALRARGYARPVIALTANNMPADRERCLAAGCDEFLSKPVDRRRLVSIISRTIARSAVTGQVHPSH